MSVMVVTEKNYEVLDNICEGCGKPSPSSELYADLFNKSWQMICPTCFYSRYSGDEKRYTSKMSTVVPDLITEKKYNTVKSSMIVIANAYPYLLPYSGEIPLPDAKLLESTALNAFHNNRKMIKKFMVLNTQVKSSQQIIDKYSSVFVVAVRAYVRFKSYLEFVEHEAFMHMRKELGNMIIN